MKRTSTLLLSMLISGAAIAQIPNSSFETWTAHTGYDTPDSWGNTNSFTTAASIYTCEKGTTGAPSGAAYLKLTSKSIPIIGVIPGVAVTGSINISGTSYSVSGGFASSSRPATLTGSWQYMAAGADHGQIAIFLSKWNTAANKRDTVSFTNYSVPGLPSMAMTWATFSITLNYQSGATPDTAMILASSSTTTPVANSYLYLDNLAFAGNVPSGVVTVVNDQAATSLYPNPANGTTALYYYSLFSGDLNISISDVTGKIVKKITANVVSGSNNITLDVAGLVKGTYLVNLSDGQGSECQKLTIN
jgi:hypothetical protein